jgi:hypothetical protein
MPAEGGVFVPVDPLLRRAPGHVIPFRFWNYINRNDLFPGGWLHDIGLPLTAALHATVWKQGERRSITYQAFERTVLTDDPLNPVDWQIERGNIGTDLVRSLGVREPVDIPAADARVMLPLHLLARLGPPGDRVQALLQWQDGTLLSNWFTLLRGEEGRGLLIGNLDWVNLPQPPQPATQRATLALRDQYGQLLAERDVVVVGAGDPATEEIQLYWTISGTERTGPQPRRILKTAQPGTAALQELLWGPPEISQVGYGTALPTPEEVLRFPGREPAWGPRVTLRRLTIVDGVATADFSQELRAYGGGSLRVRLIGEQITRTLRQFSSVREVQIAIEGQTEAALEP